MEREGVVGLDPKPKNPLSMSYRSRAKRKLSPSREEQLERGNKRLRLQKPCIGQRQRLKTRVTRIASPF
ncbi:hypothetical protein JCM19039_2322 [Geomicrobium sp. JCM 19039]|nr:hypothetical protein JCM19039_2322 [Geomicrobium sp. JCM 19039]